MSTALATVLVLNAAAIGVGLGAYGTHLLVNTRLHPPLEVSGLALAGGTYTQATCRPLRPRPSHSPPDAAWHCLPSRQSSRPTFVREVDPETIKVRVISRRRKSGDQWRRATRAVLKLGLNLAYLKLGADVALRDDWNPAREIILGLPYEGYLLIAPFDIFKTPDLHGSLLFDVPGATALSQLRYGGLELLADLRPGPVSPETRAWAEGRGMQVMDIAPRASA